MSNSPVIDALKRALAETYALYLKTQNYHWNVEGPQFSSLHALFEAQYVDLATAVDEIAEHIRSLGEKAPGSWAAFAPLVTIADGDNTVSADAMVRELADDQGRVSEALEAVRRAAEETGDDVVADAMTNRLGVHRKNRWMLNSSL